MGFRFKRKESVRHGLRRIGREQIDTAIEAMRHSHRGDAIHCVRKDIKKLRAMLRMAQPSLPPKNYRCCMKQLRDVARELSMARDAHVKLKAFQSVTQGFDNELRLHQLRYFRESLHRDFQRTTWSFTKEKTPARVERALKKIGRELDGLQLTNKGWNALGVGLQFTYSQGAKFVAGKKASSEDLHEWRKRIKDLWYQVRLLCPVWPEQMEALAKELKTLSEYLGDDHDLSLLEQAASEFCQRDGKLEEWTLLKAMIDLRRDELRKMAFALGARFYAEKPCAFCKRLSRYWQIWRHKNRQRVQISDKLPA